MDNEVWFLNRVFIWDKTFIFHFLLVSQLSQFCLAGVFFVSRTLSKWNWKGLK